MSLEKECGITSDMKKPSDCENDDDSTILHDKVVLAITDAMIQTLGTKIRLVLENSYQFPKSLNSQKVMEFLEKRLGLILY